MYFRTIDITYHFANFTKMGKKRGGRVLIKQTGPKVQPTNDFNENPIIIPAKNDPDITLYFPPSESDAIACDLDKLRCIWPSNIDSSKCCHRGRKIARKYCVDNPSVIDISEVLLSLGVRHAVQPYKGYPRDVESRWENPGRVLYDKVQMNRIDKVNEISSTTSQKGLLCMIANLVDQMPGRKERLLEANRKREEASKKSLEEKRMKAILSGKTIGTGGGNKKKGKKRYDDNKCEGS
jgi:Signal recognition particle 19 kDa protein